MAQFICRNPSCSLCDKIQTFNKVIYAITKDGVRSAQKICRGCNTEMDDITKMEGLPSEGVFKGSSNPDLKR